jgi:hypothetical protein
MLDSLQFSLSWTVLSNLRNLELKSHQLDLPELGAFEWAMYDFVLAMCNVLFITFGHSQIERSTFTSIGPKKALFLISRPCQFFCACQKFLQGSQQQVKSFSICLL